VSAMIWRDNLDEVAHCLAWNVPGW
jgi:hypothetical protein